MSEPPNKLRVIEGGGEEPKRRTRRAKVVAPNEPSLKDWNCPVCMKIDGAFSTEVAVIYRGPLTNGTMIKLQGAKKWAYLVCTRCYREDREGMHGERGAVALNEPGKGWQFLYPSLK